jgi:hypothetical protein
MKQLITLAGKSHTGYEKRIIDKSIDGISKGNYLAIIRNSLQIPKEKFNNFLYTSYDNIL